MNNQNLIPLSKRTPSELREMRSNGGKKSGELRREKKALREYLAELMTMDAEELNQSQDADKSNGRYIAAQLVQMAKNGNLRAIRTLAELIGELNRTQVAIEINQQEVEQAYNQGVKDATNDILKMLDDESLMKLTGLTPLTSEPPLVLPNGNIIWGESLLED